MNTVANIGVKNKSEEVWQGAAFDFSDLPPNLFTALRHAAHKFGGRTQILQDADDKPLNYNAIILAALALGAKLARLTRAAENVGILLPTAAPTVIVLFGLFAHGRTPAILNFAAGARFIEGACKTANIQRIVTSRRFVSAARLEKTVEQLRAIVEVIYLEDLRDELTFVDRAMALLRTHLPFGGAARAMPDEPAVILFTSGTTGAPKGVALSHRNILANIAQCQAHIPFNREWAFFNVMPIFHAFGLTGGTLLPIIGGMRAVLYPSPLDREQIPKAIKSCAANVLVATDTFARFYASASDVASLRGLKYVVLGAETVSEVTLEQFREKSGATILEGYGVTECSPVVCVNQPGKVRQGSVGQLLPGMEARLVPAPGIQIGKRLLLRGPNIMLGYLEPAGAGLVKRKAGEWFDTGDLAEIDADGFVKITGRVKRFAKVGAEMVSLAAVENHARQLWPNAHHAALAIRRGEGREVIILVTEQRGANRTTFSAWADENAIAPIEIPHDIWVFKRLPMLATGKPDYEKLRHRLEKKFRQRSIPERHVNGAPEDVESSSST